MSRAAAMLAIVLLLTGCAAKVQRPDSDRLRLGATTYDDVVKTYGDPSSRGISSTVGGITRSTIIGFTRNATASLDPGFGRKVLTYSSTDKFPSQDRREATFYFDQDILVGYDYETSSPEESADFDNGKVARIKEGETTRAEILRLLGKPDGIFLISGQSAIFPPFGRGRILLVPMLDGVPGFKYIHLRLDFSLNPFLAVSVYEARKTLVIYFGKDDVVREVLYRESAR